jgi:hypothetical protein
MKDALLDDARGYGTVVALYEGGRPLHVERVSAPLDPLGPALANTFMARRYCQILSGQIPHLYRAWDTNEARRYLATSAGPPPKGALMLGRGIDGTWFSPMRPTHAIDYRASAALKHDWNRADFILEGSLMGGASIYVGRAGPQTEILGGKPRTLPGGAIQIYVPREEFRHLTLQKWWAVV